MTKNQKYIIQLSKAAIFEEQPELPPENTDWEYIWNKAHEQNIAGLIADAVLRLPPEHQPSNADMWNEALMQTIFVMMRQFAEFERMSAVLKKNGIEPICLKGIVVKDLYPVPELRTMGDFDVFVEKEQFGHAEQIFKSEGYIICAESVGITAKKGNVVWEVFGTFEQEFRENYQTYDTFLLEHTAQRKHRQLENTYMLSHMILHFAKHLVREGSGIRNLLDIALFIRKFKSEVNLEEVFRICKEQYFENVYIYIAAVLNEYFDVRMDYKKVDTEAFIEVLLNGGVFGEMSDNVMIHQASKHEDDVGIIRRLFFPTVKMLDYRYTYLKKHPWLLPVAWVHRVFYAKKHYGYSFISMIKGVSGSIRYSKERDKRLNELNLYSKKRN